MPTQLDIVSFLEEGKKIQIIDVRTPAEFEQGHIPGALNIPIFTNEERAEIGTLYKKTGRQEAIHRGLEIFGPRMVWYIEELEKILRNSDLHQSNVCKTVCVYCWRGGMRSGSMAWLFETYGYTVFTLKKGYKTFRRLVLDEFEKDRKILVLGGKTGSGKTLILAELKKSFPVIDLEGLAHHKGSSFGAIGELPQPTQEQFENELAFALLKTSPAKNIIVEDESRKIGHRILPNKIYDIMRTCNVIYCEVPFEERAKYIAENYGKYPKEELRAATERIIKKLDTRFAKDALRFIDEGNLIESFKISLNYYDKTYNYGLEQRVPGTVKIIPFDKVNPKQMAGQIEKELVSEGMEK